MCDQILLPEEVVRARLDCMKGARLVLQSAVPGVRHVDILHKVFVSEHGDWIFDGLLNVSRKRVSATDFRNCLARSRFS